MCLGGSTPPKVKNSASGDFSCLLVFPIRQTAQTLYGPAPICTAITSVIEQRVSCIGKGKVARLLSNQGVLLAFFLGLVESDQEEIAFMAWKSATRMLAS